jgi:penicillin-binding protein 1A
MVIDRRRRNDGRRTRRSRFVRMLVLALLLALVALLSLATGLYVSLVGNLPSLEAQEEYTAAQTTKIFDNAEPPHVLAQLHGVENREIVSADQIPKHMRDAVVAVEDERFYSHPGVDLRAILRALWADLRHGSVVEGGSTITQQFVKNAYVSDQKTLDRKVKEAALAYQLEKKWSKEKILNEYLNIIYFGEGAWGVEAAATEYFGVHAEALTVAQAAMLAGITKSPANYSPRRDPERALERRNLILNKMFQQGYITGDQLRTALADSVKLAPTQVAEDTKVPYWVEMVREQLVAKYGANTVLQGGLRVYTSIDLDKQALAEKAIKDILDKPGDPTASLVSIDVHTGRVLAMVGGFDFKNQQFNIAVQGHRQPGSAFKTFVLITALTQNISPSTTYDSGPFTLTLPGDDWKVKSTDEGMVALADATARSINGVYARLIMDVGPQKVAETARHLGIETNVDSNPAIALGGLKTGVSPLEMAVAYGTIASGGDRLSGSVVFDPEHPLFPIAIVKVTDAAGNVIDDNHVVRTQVIDPRIAYTATDVLKGVIDYGTARAADIGRPAAGKTGTTQEYRDAWFVGYTPDVVTAVWVGYPDQQKPMTNVHGIRVTGGSFPAQIWAAYMRGALAEVPRTDFGKPTGTEWVTVSIDPASGQLATEWCPDRQKSSFLKGSEPTEYCTLHRPAEAAVPDVTSRMLAEAEAALQGAGFAARTIEQREPTSPAGTVIGQDPPAGTMLLQGSTVTLTVTAGGPRAATVPDVLGRGAASARETLAAAGFEVIETPTPSEAAPGVVVDQDPAAGAASMTGQTVTIVVSSGAEQPTTTIPTLLVVPDVTGMRMARASLVLRQAGLTPTADASLPNDDPAVAGTVASQSPAAGGLVPPDTVVSLIVYATPG